MLTVTAPNFIILWIPSFIFLISCLKWMLCFVIVFLDHCILSTDFWSCLTCTTLAIILDTENLAYTTDLDPLVCILLSAYWFDIDTIYRCANCDIAITHCNTLGRRVLNDDMIHSVLTSRLLANQRLLCWPIVPYEVFLYKWMTITLTNDGYLY